MDIYEKLTDDHRKARAAIAELRAQAGEGPAEAREALFRRLRRELEAHVAFEEEVFYPAVAEDEDSKDGIEEALAEHDEATALLEELAELDKGSEEFDLRLGELDEALEHHVLEEETVTFTAAREAISDERAVEMARRHDAAMAEPGPAK
jgi:iron-sulfur cluster repair protein YtfE (RIC family)